MVLGFTLVKNVGYVLAESTAMTAATSLGEGELEIAMQSIDRAIRLAPDVGRYYVTRANVLDKVRRSRSDTFEQTKLALESYQANARAVNANPFETYASFHLAESTLTLAALGHPGKGGEAIKRYQRLTIMLPRYWRSHSLLGRAYVEVGEPAYAIEAFNRAIYLDPMSPQLYDDRAEAYRLLGAQSLALADYDTAITLSPSEPSRYARRGVAHFALGRLEKAIQDFDQEIGRIDREIALLVQFRRLHEAGKWNPQIALAYNNRGSAHYQLGRIERAVEDYDCAIQFSPRSAEFYANWSLAYELLNKDADALRDKKLAIELGFDPALMRQD
jgi:tetratricopeptide (TPR) repeat protein